MTIPTYSALRLTPVIALGPRATVLTVTTDPEITRTWEPRKSVQAVLGGGRVTQDFGRYARDCELTLRWAGKGQWLDRDVVRTLDAWLGDRGSTYRYEDESAGDEFTVELLTFVAAREFGQPRLYTAELKLGVLTMDQLRGEAYVGA